MAVPERLMVAATIPEPVLGAAHDTLPPHMTLFPWFDLPPAHWPAFDEGMQDIAEMTVAPTVCGGEMAVYGVNEDISVRRLNRATRTFNIIRGLDIHMGVCGLVRALGDNYDDTFTGLNWSPHISDKHGFSLGEDETVSFTNMTVFEKSAQGKKIVRAIYRWSEVLV